MRERSLGGDDVWEKGGNLDLLILSLCNGWNGVDHESSLVVSSYTLFFVLCVAILELLRRGWLLPFSILPKVNSCSTAYCFECKTG